MILKNLNRKLNNPGAASLMTVIAFVIFITAAVLYTRSPGVVLCFLVYNLVYIQLPGLLILGKHSSVRPVSERLLISYFLGFGFWVIQYYVFCLLGTPVLFKILSPCISLYYLITVKPYRSLRSAEVSPGLLGMIAFGVFCSMASVIIAGLDTGAARSVRVYKDYLWHIGNVTLLSRGTPFDDLRMTGIGFYYHYFGDLLFGMCKNIFMLRSYDLVIKCAPFLVGYVFTIGLFSFMRKLFRRPAIGCLLFYCAGMTVKGIMISGEKWISLLNYHIFANVNWIGIALAAMFAAFLYLCEYTDEGKRAFYIKLSLLSVAMTGLKGPVAAVLLLAVVIAGVIRIAFSSDTDLVKASIVMLVSFAAAYAIFIKGPQNLLREANNNRIVYLSLTETFLRSPLGELLQPLLSLGAPGYILYALAGITFGSVLVFGPAFVLFTLGGTEDAIRLIRDHELPDNDVLISFLAGCTGIGAYWLLSQEGFSHSYFAFAAVPFIVRYCAGKMKSSGESRIPGGVLRCTAFAIALWTLGGGVIFVHQIGQAFREMNETREVWATEDPGSHDLLTAGELEGMEWIRRNTPEEAVLAVDRMSLTKYVVTCTDNCRFFYYSAFSERPVYLEGFSYSDVSDEEIDRRLKVNGRIYCKNSESGANDHEDAVSEAEDAALEAGVDYIVVTKRFTENFIPGTQSDLFRKVFENGSIEVYEVVKR